MEVVENYHHNNSQRNNSQSNCANNKNPIESLTKTFTTQNNTLNPLTSLGEYKASISSLGNLVYHCELDTLTTRGGKEWYLSYEHKRTSSKGKLFRDLYIPPVVAHNIILHKSPGGLLRTKMGDKEDVHNIQGNEIQIIPAQQPVKFRLESEHEFHMLHLLISPACFNSFLRNSTLTLNPHVQIECCFGKPDKIAAELLSAFVRSAGSSYGHSFSSIGNALAIYFSEQYGTLDPSHTLCFSRDQMDSIKHAMIEQLGFDFDVNKLASKLGLTKSGFNQKFKETTGLTPLQYFNNLRMQQAREQVEKSEKSLTEIALNLGFYDAAHFSKTFNKHWKVSPSKLRENSAQL